MMVSWPIVKAEMRRNPPPPRAKRRRFFHWQFWFGFWIGGLSVAAMILAWRLYLPIWTLGV
jgi:hypothetical protein